MDERIISIIGEGVEFAVATDHNHHTDYQPTINELGGNDFITAITGNEVSTPVGHFNAFPLEPAAAPIEHRIGDARAIFTMIRQQTNPFGITPVIQLNHPRWGSIDYFGRTRLDPVTAASANAEFSYDFDTIEVLNENAAWGYRNAETGGSVPTGSSRHSVLEDWFNLLNRGHRYAAVGNSDSHHVEQEIAGVPRNYLPSTTDDAGAIDAREVAQNLRQRRVFTTTGPFVEFRVNDLPMGSTIRARDRTVTVAIRIQAASWIDVDRVKLIFNGDVIDERPVPAGREVERFNTQIDLTLPHDGWLALLVEGDEPMAPIFPDTARPILPIAIANPVWIDVDGDGAWTSPVERIARWMESADFERARLGGTLGDLGAREQALMLENAPTLGRAVAVPLVDAGLESPDRVVRLAAAKAAATLRAPALLPRMRDALRQSSTDRYLGALLLIALHATEPNSITRHLMAYADQFGSETAGRFREELEPILPGRPISNWLVAGYFPGGGREPLENIHDPEDQPDVAQSFTGRNDTTVRWEPRFANDRGYLSLRGLSESDRDSENAIAYAQVWVRSDRARDVPFIMGTDDRGQLIVRGDIIYENSRTGAANPLGHIGRVPLERGWNRLLLKIENGRGEFGFYFRLLETDLTVSVVPGDS